MPGVDASTLPAKHQRLLSRAEKLAGQKQRSLWSNAFRQFRHHHLAMVGMALLIFFILATFLGGFVWTKPINAIDFNMTSAGFSRAHPLGTDTLGQDILARIIWGGRVSLTVGLLSATVSILIGTLVGAVAGFFGGFTDSLMMRITDLFISLPQLPLLLLVTFLFRDSMYNQFDKHFNNGNIGIFVLIVLVISVFAWMPTARLVRASFLSIREKEFVEAARASGATRTILIFRHILPNVLSPIIVAATLSVGSAIITESVLSFLGLGFPSDVPTCGRMLYDAKDYIQFSPHEAMVPGVMIFLTVLSVNYIGDGLRDALDPHKSH